MAAPPKVQSTASGKLVVVTPEGELDLATSPVLRDALGAACDAGALTVVLDLALVTFLDSTTLGVLVGANKRLRGLGGRLIVVNAGGEPLKVMQLTGLATAFEVHGSGSTLDAELMALLEELETSG